MPLSPEIQAVVDKLVADSGALDVAQDASHTALQHLADTTLEQQGLVIQAQANAGSVIAVAQGEADSDVRATEAAKAVFDDDLDRLVALATAAKV